MKLTVIGYWGAYPGSGGASSGYLLEDSNESLLLDCGSGVLSKLYEYTDISQLNNVILSHYHSDHIADVGCLQYAAKVQMSLGERKDPLSIYGHTLSEYFNRLSYEDASIGKPLEEGSAVSIGPFTLHFKHTTHPAPALAMKIESESGSFGYSADTAWNDSLVDFFSGVDLLLCESSLYNKFKGRVPGHLTAGEAGLLAKKAGVGQLVLTHMPHFGDLNDLKIEAGNIYKGKIDLAESGKTWIC